MDWVSNRDEHDLIVLSDFHLGEGLMESEPRYAPTEDFFHDRQFAHFLDLLREEYADRAKDLILVFNGDIFDFLTVTRVPTDSEAESRGFKVLPSERDFGLNPTEEKSVYKLDVIVSGHKLFFKSLAAFVSAGFRVIILPGNHDLELHFKGVRKRLISHLAAFQERPNRTLLEERIEFRDWYYIEPGRVFIEHGNQYDSGNSIRHPLRPILSKGKWWKEEEKNVLDYPLGSIFVRFFYNRVRTLDPYTPRLLSFEQYLDFIRRYNLFDVWRVYRDHYPHFLSALSPRAPGGGSDNRALADIQQTEDFKERERSEPFGDLYEKLSQVKVAPDSASKPHVVKEMISPVVRRGMWFSLFAFIAVFIWVGLFNLIDMVPWFPANALLMSLFAVTTFGGLIWAWIHLQRKLRRKSAGSMTEQFKHHAEEIADLTQVSMVLMGHTHRVDFRRILDGKAVYANSGTWTSVENPWRRIMRDARRLTFLFVKGDEVELCRFNDDAGRIDDVPLFYLDETRIPDNLSFDATFSTESRREHSWLPSSDVPMSDDEEVGGI